jgi:glucose-6-phosphate 1-dehydrogenase
MGSNASAKDTPQQGGGRTGAGRPAPCSMVIFGAGGDLTKRLLMPALYNLSRTNMLPDSFALVAVDRADETAESWCKRMRETLESFVGDDSAEFDIDRVDDEAWQRLVRDVTYVCGDLTKPEIYRTLRDATTRAGHDDDTGGNVIFYLAVSDRLFGTVVDALGEADLVGGQRDGGGSGGWRRVIIEKPFGHSLKSAHDLNARLLRTLQEDQIYRIDHFLGKDTVQSIMAFRFANGLFEPVWNRDRIDHVQITAAETIGVQQRGAFYEETGALRDMVPNHLFTLLSLVAMEPPTDFGATEVRNKKFELLAAMPAVTADCAVRGQYGSGTVLDSHVPAYREEEDVDSESDVETYAALEARIDNWRWAGVPFYLRTGKRLGRRRTEIAIRFKQAPYAVFSNTPVDALRPNWLVLCIAPDEGVTLRFQVRRPGPSMTLATVRMDFYYDDWFPEQENVGYETLILDVMNGDPTSFMRADMVEQTWRIVQPVLDAWSGQGGRPPAIYPAGSAGPDEADALLAREGRAWRPVSGDDSP